MTESAGSGGGDGWALELFVVVCCVGMVWCGSCVGGVGAGEEGGVGNVGCGGVVGEGLGEVNGWGVSGDGWV